MTFISDLIFEGSDRSTMTSRPGIRGLCVPGVRPGDEIICLYGTNMPFVLKPGHGHYRIVGGVNLPGLSDWTALNEGLGEGSLTEATFRIR
jgi:hypothetical protein